MIRSRVAVAALVALPGFLVAAPAHATAVRIDFSGVFSVAGDPAGLLDGLPIGTPFSGFVEYDSSWPRSRFRTTYYSTPPASGRIRLRFAGGNTTRAGEMSVEITNDGPRGDEVVFAGIYPPSSVFFTPTEILRFDVVYVAFRDATGAVLPDGSLPGHLPPGLQAQVETTGCRWTASTQFDYCDPFTSDTFLAGLRIDSYRVVPEPGAAALVALGIALLAARAGARYGAHTNCDQ